MKNRNEAIAVWLTAKVGSMWTAYLFCLLALLSLPAVLTTAGLVPERTFPQWLISVGMISLVAWIAQTFIQLVLLPIIMVGQAVASRRIERLIQETHDAAMEERLSMKDMMLDVHALMAAVHATVVTPDPTMSVGTNRTEEE